MNKLTVFMFWASIVLATINSVMLMATVMAGFKEAVPWFAMGAVGNAIAAVVNYRLLAEEPAK